MAEARYVCDSDGVDGEKTLISIKRFPKYGTSNLCQSSKISSLETIEYFIKHIVKETDTLNSIALKYGLKTSTIKRVNRLWNDSIFLCHSLLIPIQGQKSIPHDYEGEILTRAEALKSLAKSKQNTSSPTCSQNTLSPDFENAVLSTRNGPTKTNGLQFEQQTSSTDDYFSKFDSSISEIKSNLEKLEREARTSGTEPGRKSSKKSNSRLRVSKSLMAEPSMKFYKSPDGSSEAKLQEKFEKLENEIFQL